MVEGDFFAEVEHRKADEDEQGDHFLDGFELGGAIDVIADAVGGHGEAIFDERNSPGDEDDEPEGGLREFEMPVPGEGHENIAEGK